MPNKLGTNAIGPSFASELAAQNLLGLPFAWGSDGALQFGAGMTSAQITAVEAVYAAHDPTVVPLAMQAASLIASGCPITSTGAPALDATYPCDPTAQQHLNAEVTSLLLNGTFLDGSTSIAWQDTAGTQHTFTVAQYKTLGTAIGGFVSSCLKVINGQSTTLPTTPVTIA